MTIEEICRKYHITNYTINEDETIDVDGGVDWGGKGLEKLPLEFKHVRGNFSCSGNKLTTLEGCPREVGGNFMCSDNLLTSLEGCPKYIGYDFDCYGNQLTNIDFLPEELGGDFYCLGNPVGTMVNGLSLEFLQFFKRYKVVKGDVVNLKRLKYIMNILEIKDREILINEIEKNYTIV